MWVVLYDDGTSLTTVSEPIAQSLAEAERQRGHQVTVRLVADDAASAPEPEPIRPARPEPSPEHEPAAPAAGQARAAEPAQAPEPARARPAGRRRLLRYAIAAAAIVVAAALADHWDVLPSVGATTSSGSTQVGGPSERPQLLPPLDQPPVMHFSDRARG
jgi:ferric-dicitrate binding protein FerR (iron transport regulator)